MSASSAVSWSVWARGLVGLSPTERLVVFELARLADCRGVVITSIGHLVGMTGRSRRAIFEALASLEGAGRISREARRVAGHQAASRFQLHQAVSRVRVRVEARLPESLVDLAGSGESEAVDVSDNEGLRELLADAVSEGWEGGAAARLASTIVEAGPRQFHAAIARGRELGHLGREEAIVDTLGVAWEMARLNAGDLIAARSPWALWTTMVTRACGPRDQEGAGVSAVAPLDMPEEGLRPGEGNTGEVTVSVDDFEGPIALMVEALVRAGMDETLAWAGTLRIVELAVGDASRRHTLAGSDPRLVDLGVPAECARSWMTLLAGSRRGTKAGIVEVSEVELDARARLVVEALRTAA